MFEYIYLLLGNIVVMFRCFDVACFETYERNYLKRPIVYVTRIDIIEKKQMPIGQNKNHKTSSVNCKKRKKERKETKK